MVQATNFNNVAPGTPVTRTANGTRIHDSFAALLSQNAGPTPPPYKDNGTPWYDTSVSPGVLRRWDGSAWIAMASINAPSLHGNSNWTMTAADAYAVPSVLFTAARIWTLPAAASVPAGSVFVIDDINGYIPAALPLAVRPYSGDTIGGSAADLYLAARCRITLISDGSGTWSYGISGPGADLLEYQQASNAPAIGFSLAAHIARGFNRFRIDCIGILSPVAGGRSLRMLFSNDGGSTYLANKIDGVYSRLYDGDWFQNDNYVNVTYLGLADNIGNTQPGHGSTKIEVGSSGYNRLNTDFGGYIYSGGVYYQTWHHEEAIIKSDFNFVSLAMSTGNIASGAFILRGES